MDIRDFMDVSLLEDIMTVWSKATGMATIAMDNDEGYLTGEIGFTDFCTKHTRGNREGLRRCTMCDAMNTGVYFCHAGLMDFSIDITLTDGTCLGKIIGGQILPKEPNIEEFRELARELGVDEDAYIEALSHIEIRSEEAIRASADLLGKAVNLLVNSEYTKKYQENMIDQLSEENKLDPMTRVYNKAMLEDLVTRKIRDDHPFALIMVDIDNFKDINDSYGHATGDYVLKTFAWKLKGEFRDSDIIGRFGGDEFYLVLTGEQERYPDYGRRICEVIKKVRPSGVKEDITVSVGIAAWPEHGADCKHLLDCADRALYKIKNSGKRAFAVYEGDIETVED